MLIKTSLWLQILRRYNLLVSISVPSFEMSNFCWRPLAMVSVVGKWMMSKLPHTESVMLWGLSFMGIKGESPFRFSMFRCSWALISNLHAAQYYQKWTLKKPNKIMTKKWTLSSSSFGKYLLHSFHFNLHYILLFKICFSSPHFDTAEISMHLEMIVSYNHSQPGSSIK